MDYLSYAIVVGILSSVFIFGIKSGIGCGFSRTGKLTVAALCIFYLIVSTVAGYFMDAFDVSSFLTSTVSTMIHITLALFLLFGGIATIKKWHQGCDISRKTFLILAFPCPVCLSALMISAAALSTVIEADGMLIGFIVGLVFVISIIVSTLFFRNLGYVCRLIHIPFDGTPEALGTIMIFIGLFYLVAAVLIPAYMNAGDMPAIASVPFGESELFAYIAALLLVIIGAIGGSGKMKKSENKKS